jgi:hypothetical protein
MQRDRLELLRRIKVKNRSILSFLAIGAFIAAPLLAEKIPDASMERGSGFISMGGAANGHLLRDVSTGRNVGPAAFRDSNPALHMRDFDEDGRLGIMNDGSHAGRGDIDFLPVGLTNADRLEKIDKKDIGKNLPMDVDHNGSSLPPVVVPEPEAFTLVLLGVGVLGMLLHRRNSA